MTNFLIETRQVTLVKSLKIRWANKLKNLLNQESIIFKRPFWIATTFDMTDRLFTKLINDKRPYYEMLSSRYATHRLIRWYSAIAIYRYRSIARALNSWIHSLKFSTMRKYVDTATIVLNGTLTK